MALRQVIKIDEELCTGCGDCVPSCEEGAIQIVDGKAKLVGDNLCDGLGACLGDCPEGALTLEERDADEFDEVAVKQHMDKSKIQAHPHAHEHGPGGGCPGARMIQFDAPEETETKGADDNTGPQPSALRQWPVQLHLVPPTAPYYKSSDVLLAADCTAFAIGDFHQKHLKGKALAIACPKLDQGSEIYIQKLVSMIDDAEINTLTVMIMEVPCCGGLLEMAKEAASRANRKVPIKQVFVGLKGNILKEVWV